MEFDELEFYYISKLNLQPTQAIQIHFEIDQIENPVCQTPFFKFDFSKIKCKSIGVPLQPVLVLKPRILNPKIEKFPCLIINCRYSLIMALFVDLCFFPRFYQFLRAAIIKLFCTDMKIKTKTI
jgi:hypothetical protein